MVYSVENSHASKGSMNEAVILETIRTLAHSQGTYGRIYEQIMEAQPAGNNNLAENPILSELAGHNLKDAVELVMLIEC